MAINYPTSLDTLSNPSSTDLVENATAALDHDVQHSNANDAIEALEAKVGANSSAVTTSHDYKLSEVTSTDKAVGKTATQTLTNKTLTSPVVNVGSDATGDLYYRNGSGVFTRLPIGSASDILTVIAGIPAWITNPAAADASTTVKGVVEIATTAEITAGTSAGATGAKLVVPADAVAESGADKILKLNSSGYLPALNASLLTNLPNPIIYKNGVTSKNIGDASATQNIAHGLGRIPRNIRIHTLRVTFAGMMTYNGSTASYISSDNSNGTYVNTSTTIIVYGGVNQTEYITGTVTFDDTNIIITWVKTNNPSGTLYIAWEAEA